MSETVVRPGSPYAVNLTRQSYVAEAISAAPDEVVDTSTARGNPSGSRPGTGSIWTQAR
jgi:hypothetical protein